MLYPPQSHARRSVAFNFVRYAVAIAYTPKDKRPSEAREISRHFVSFAIKLFKDPDFRRKLLNEKRKKTAPQAI